MACEAAEEILPPALLYLFTAVLPQVLACPPIDRQGLIRPSGHEHENTPPTFLIT